MQKERRRKTREMTHTRAAHVFRARPLDSRFSGGFYVGQAPANRKKRKCRHISFLHSAHVLPTWFHSAHPHAHSTCLPVEPARR